MNAYRSFPPTTANAGTNPGNTPQSAAAIVAAMPTRHIHRERAFGVGYGNSSGYASTRQYASNWAPPRFAFS